MRGLIVVLVVTGLFFGISKSSAAELTPSEESRIKELALEAILEHPEIIAEAIDRLQALEEERQSAAIKRTLENRRADLERDANAPVLGNPNGDVTMVEFFDYNCPYCKRAMEPVKNLLADDSGVRLVYREFPILGEGSLFAAKVALAAREQDKYEEMHWALMSLRRADEQTTMEAAEELGLDIEKLREDMEAPEVSNHIALSLNLAEGLGISGTPSFVVGDTIVPGLVPLERLVELVESERADARE